VGIPHKKWGECVIVAHAPELEVVLPELWTKAADRLAKYKWPKQAVAVSPWPVNAMGKLNTRRVAESVRETLGGDRA
jgi:acyl-CoA synthetase (AMP-forming)/AMP-acid ligase II